MSVFVSQFLSGSFANNALLKTELESLPMQLTVGAGSAQSSNSATYVTIATVTLNLSLDDVVLLIGQIGLSSSNGVSSLASIAMFRNTAQLTGDAGYQDAVSGTSGDNAHPVFVTTDQNQAGSTTYELKFKRYGGAGTIYTNGGSLIVCVFKKRT